MDAARHIEELATDIGPATVLAPSGRAAVVRFEDGASGTVTLAVDGYEARPGDRVLVARGRTGAWAIAVLHALREAEPVRAKDGASARLEEGALVVRDGAGRMLFSHHPDEGVSVLCAPHGDLRLSAPTGSIELESGVDVKIEAARALTMEGKRVSLRAPAAREEDESALRLDRDGADLRAPRLSASAAVARLALLDTTFAATHVQTAIATARHVAGVVETRAERLVERAKNAFREVEELAQTKAGRIRHIAEGAVHVTGQRAIIEARDDVAIKGDKIHLA